jgi:hypothetical protein
MHYDRIHVKCGKSIPRKQKYADLSVLFTNDLSRTEGPGLCRNDSSETTNMTENDGIFSSPGIAISSFDHDIHPSVSCKLDPDDYFPRSGLSDHPGTSVKDEVPCSDSESVSDSVSNSPSMAETVGSIVVSSSATDISTLNALRNLTPSSAVIFTFGDGLNASIAPNSTIGSFVKFSTRNLKPKTPSTGGSEEIHFTVATTTFTAATTTKATGSAPTLSQSLEDSIRVRSERKLFEPTSPESSDYKNPSNNHNASHPQPGISCFYQPRIPHDFSFESTASPHLFDPSESASRHPPQEYSAFQPVFSNQQGEPRNRPIHPLPEQDPYQPNVTQQFPASSFEQMDDCHSRRFAFNTPNSRRKILDGCSSLTFSSCQQTGARVHEYLLCQESMASIQGQYPFAI